MKKIVFVLTALLITITLTAQEQTPKSKAERKAERKERKEQIEKELTINTEKAIMMNQYVLKATQLRNKYGQMIMVNPTINFVAVKGKDVYVQFGTESGIGYNGVGGITFRGELTDSKLTRDQKHGGYSIQITTTGVTGTLTIFVQSNITGENADARVQSNWGGQLTFVGEIEPIKGRSFFKGQESY
jgi:hypothetical protein